MEMAQEMKQIENTPKVGTNFRICIKYNLLTFTDQLSSREQRESKNTIGQGR